MDKDFYKTLGITKSATEQEIKAAYRKKALEWHPDRNKAANAAEKFKEVNEAYEVLSNPQKRQTYDQFGSSAFSAQGGPASGWNQGGFNQGGPFNYSYRTYGAGQNPFEGMDLGGFSDPFEIFEQFFGGGFANAQNRGRTRRRQVYSLQISFLEAARGAEKTVEIGGKQMKIKIPAGVDEGSRVRFGDFDIVISVLPDKTFKREGLDIIVEVAVNFPEAVLGTTVDVPTISGPVTLKIPSGTQPGTMMRLRERGVHDPHYNRVGDQYVRIKVTVPTKLTHEQKELLEKYEETISDKKRGGWF